MSIEKSSRLLLAGLFYFFLTACGHTDWRNADRSSTGLAPNPQIEKRAVVQVYVARTFGWRGFFAVHSWMATKEANAPEYTTYQVIGYRLYENGRSVVIRKDLPDRKWFGAMPTVIETLIGEKAESAILKIKEASNSYTYANTYRVWPGPNSNTYISHLIRNTPELSVELPPHAIGRDWLDHGDFFGRSESKTGFQFSIYGALGFTAGLGEGLEINILGLTFGVDVMRPALKLPFVGRVGMNDAPAL